MMREPPSRGRGFDAGYVRDARRDDEDRAPGHDPIRDLVSRASRFTHVARQALDVIARTEERQAYDDAKGKARGAIADARMELGVAEQQAGGAKRSEIEGERARIDFVANQTEEVIAERDAAIALALSGSGTGFARVLYSARIPPRGYEGAAPQRQPAPVPASDEGTLYSDVTGAAKAGQMQASPQATPAVDEGSPWTPVVVTVRKRDGHVKVWRGLSDAIGPLRVVGVASEDGGIDWGDAGEYDDFRLYARKDADKFKTVSTFAGKDAHSIIIAIGIDVDIEGGTSNEDASDAAEPTGSGARPHVDDRPGVTGGARDGEGEERSWQDQPWADKPLKVGKQDDEARDGATDGADVAPRGGKSKNPAGRTKGGKNRPDDKHDGDSKARGGGQNDEIEEDSSDRSWEHVPEGHEGGDYKVRPNADPEGIVGGEGKDGRGVPQGSDWIKFFEFDYDVALLISVGLILSEANITGIGDGLIKKSLKKLRGVDEIKEEIQKTIAKQAAKKADELAEQLAKEAPERWEKLSRRERADLKRQAREAIEEQAYRDLQDHVHREADRYAAWADASAKDAAKSSDSMIDEIARDDALNLERVEEVRAAVDELAPAPRARDAPYDPRTARKDLEKGHPGEVDGTVPAENAKNARKAGERHDESGVVFDRRGFPVFDDVAAFDTRIPASTTKVRDRQVHMRAATRQLREAVEAGQVAKGTFTEKALADIQAGKAQIDGWRWHHHQERGRMQLVPADVHDNTGHTGGFETWYGGADE